MMLSLSEYAHNDRYEGGDRLTAMPPDDVGSPFGCDTTEAKEL